MKIKSIRWDDSWKFQGIIEINNNTHEFHGISFYNEGIIVDIQNLIIYDIFKFSSFNDISKVIEIELNEKYSQEACYQYYQDQLDMKEDIDFEANKNN